MKKYNLMPNYIRKSKKKNKNERIEDNVKPNLLNRNFTIDAPNKVWDTDVTYLIFKDSRAYLSTIIDLYDRKVIAYKISIRNDNKLVMDTLNEAISKIKDVSGLILHSDQGFQYTSYEYKAICESNGITISMARKGTPIDDSPIESWHSLLKKETLYNNDITSLENYIELVEEWIEFYNTTRIKGKKVDKKKGYKKNDKLKYKLETVIEYLKDNSGYDYKLYNQIYPDMGEPDSNIVEYVEDVLYMINLLIDNK